MEKRASRESESRESRENFDREDLTLNGTINQIREIAAYNARAPLSNEEQVLLFLKSWWCKTYNRPLKDPLLQTYTLEELLYEFYDKIEREKATTESIEQEADKIEETKEKESLDWAEKEELRELQELEKNGKTPEELDPTKDPKNVEWMNELIEKQKQIFGEDFGEDLNLSLDE